MYQASYHDGVMLGCPTIIYGEWVSEQVLNVPLDT